jgi:hypothetical protein
MSETKTTETTAPSKPELKCDEKGLNVKDRTLLRVLVEYHRIVRAGARMGENISIDFILTQQTMIAEIMDLLKVAATQAEGIGMNIDETIRYLVTKDEEDRKVFAEWEKQHNEHQHKDNPLVKLLSGLLATGDPCSSCGKPTCANCKECHDCGTKVTNQPLN